MIKGEIVYMFKFQKIELHCVKNRRKTHGKTKNRFSF